MARNNFPRLVSLTSVLILLSFPALSEIGGSSTTASEASIFESCEDNSPWCKTFFFGMQFLPDYQQEGEKSFDGLNEQSFFGHFNFDAVKKPMFGRNPNRIDNFGFNISLFQSGGVKQEQGETAEERNAVVKADDGANVPTSFDQINDNVSIEAYYGWNLKRNVVNAGHLNTGLVKGSLYGVRLLGGAITQNDSVEGEDTLSAYGAVGMQYRFYRSLPSRRKNSVPAGEFFVGLALFENWAKQEYKLTDIFKDGRLLFRGSYNIGGTWFIGMYVNGGRGPDDVSVFFGTKKTTDDLLRFIGLKTAK